LYKPNAKHIVPTAKSWPTLMPFKLINDPKHWRERAEEVRTLSDQMDHPESRRVLLRIAEDYDRLAEHAEQRTAGAAAVESKRA
jgi:hypothetical protein